VTRLEYEAYEAQVGPVLQRVADELRGRWPTTGRIVLLHRFGPLDVTDIAVVVVVSAPHRAEAFEAARFGIDTVKATAPIWKREVWAEGESWGLEAQHVPTAGAS
jgi:molybdopterin synthase catalytic subunit